MSPSQAKPEQKANQKPTLSSHQINPINAINPINQYYLQSMGIDVYVERFVPATDVDSDHKNSRTPAALPVAPEITLSDLMANTLITDICCLLNITPDAIVGLGDNTFRFGSLDWRFIDEQAVELEQNQLLTPLPQQLTTVNAKRALWSCLVTWLDKAIQKK